MTSPLGSVFIIWRRITPNNLDSLFFFFLLLSNISLQWLLIYRLSTLLKLFFFWLNSNSNILNGSLVACLAPLTLLETWVLSFLTRALHLHNVAVIISVNYYAYIACFRGLSAGSCWLWCETVASVRQRAWELSGKAVWIQSHISAKVCQTIRYTFLHAWLRSLLSNLCYLKKKT